MSNFLFAEDRDVLNYNEERWADFFYVVISEDEIFEQVELNLQEGYFTGGSCSFALINGDNLSMKEKAEVVNDILNRRKNISLEHAYLVIVGDSEFFERNYELNSMIFARVLYLRTGGDEMFPEKISNAGFAGGEAFVEAIQALQEYRTWNIAIHDIKTNNARDLNGGVQGISVGLHIGHFVSSSHNVEGYIPSNFMNYGIHFIQPMGKRFQLKVETGVGVRMPSKKKVQSEMQSQMRSQMGSDPSSMTSGDPVEVAIDMEMKGHMFFSLGTSVQYFVINRQNFGVYMGMGFSLSNLSAFKMRIDTTMEIVPSEMMSGGGDSFSGSGFDNNSSGADANNPYRLLNTFMSSGLFIKLTDRTRFSFNAEYHFSPSSMNETLSGTINYWNINFGLSFRLIRKNMYYEFVRN